MLRRLLCILFISLSLTACGGGGSGEESNNNNNNGSGSPGVEDSSTFIPVSIAGKAASFEGGDITLTVFFLKLINTITLYISGLN